MTRREPTGQRGNAFGPDEQLRGCIERHRHYLDAPPKSRALKKPFIKSRQLLSANANSDMTCCQVLVKCDAARESFVARPDHARVGIIEQLFGGIARHNVNLWHDQKIDLAALQRLDEVV